MIEETNEKILDTNENKLAKDEDLKKIYKNSIKH